MTHLMWISSLGRMTTLLEQVINKSYSAQNLPTLSPAATTAIIFTAPVAAIIYPAALAMIISKAVPVMTD